MAKKTVKTFNKVALYLVSIGAWNWLLVSLADFDLVAKITTDIINSPGLGTLLYTLIGASGAWIGIQAFMGNVNIK